MKRILVVDDDQEMLEMLKLVLENRFEVGTAADGLEALLCLENGSFDAILLDLSMPILDGAGVIREMRRRGFAIPVAICSGEIDIAQTAAELEICEYVSKPVGAGHLVQMLIRMTTPERRVRGCSGIREAEA